MYTLDGVNNSALTNCFGKINKFYIIISVCNVLTNNILQFLKLMPIYTKSVFMDYKHGQAYF